MSGLLYRLLYIPPAGTEKAAPNCSETASNLLILWSGWQDLNLRPLDPQGTHGREPLFGYVALALLRTFSRSQLYHLVRLD